MEQFVAVAIAHFLALLVPGVDFFLIARTALVSGWRSATGACLGIATANGVFIAAAFSSLCLISHPLLLAAIQLIGGAFLMTVGISFLRAQVRIDAEREPGARRTTWLANFGLGIASGLLNPKNALFYVSLAAAIGSAPPTALAFYGAWMVAVVLLWDVVVAGVLGSRRALARMERVLPWLTRIAGAFLILFGGAMIASSAIQQLGL